MDGFFAEKTKANPGVDAAVVTCSLDQSHQAKA